MDHLDHGLMDIVWNTKDNIFSIMDVSLRLGVGLIALHFGICTGTVWSLSIITASFK